MSNRYVVTSTPDRRAWGILDRELYGYCAILDESVSPLPVPLEWKSRAAAEAWLQRCYRMWQAELVPAPDNWKPLPYRPNPWE